MKIIIAGSRGITDYMLVRQAVIDSGLWTAYKRKLEVVCGMAKGVDLLGRDFAKCNKLIWHEFPAAWDDLEAPGAVIRTRRDGKQYNVKAGTDRNIEMGKFSDGLIAIWDGESRGTKQMIYWAVENGLFVFVQNLKTGGKYWYNELKDELKC